MDRSLPGKEGMMVFSGTLRDPGAPASERQLGYLSQLGRSRDWASAEGDLFDWVQRGLVGDRVTKGQASAAIEFLQGCGEIRPVVEPNLEPAVEPGMYRHDGTLYRLQRGKTSGALYAMLAVVSESGSDGEGRPVFSARFSYSFGTVREIRASERLSLEEAGRLGRLWRVCIDCGAELTDGKRRGADGLTPLQRGIGPVCYLKYAGGAL
jgi:hypothetical protein